MAQPDQHFAVPADHVHRHVVARRLAGFDRGERDRGRDGTRQILVVQQLRIRRRGKHTGQRCSNKMMHFRHETSPVVRLPRGGGMTFVIRAAVAARALNAPEMDSYERALAGSPHEQRTRASGYMTWWVFITRKSRAEEHARGTARSDDGGSNDPAKPV